MNIEVTYGFLAAINEQKEIKDLGEIFIPLIKRALSKLNEEGVKEGILSDIKERADRIYSLDIPYPLLDKMVRNISIEENEKQPGSFKYFSDRGFMMEKYIFADYEDIIKQQEKNINLLEDEFKKYVEDETTTSDEMPAVVDFIDQNTKALSEFFANCQEPKIDAGYFLHAKFLLKLQEDNKELFETAKKIYLGSIIASYLTMEIEQTEHDCELLLDTSFIVSLFGLSSQEHEHTSLKVLDLSQKLGYTIAVLSETIEETAALLRRKAREFRAFNLMQQIKSDDVYAACKRKNYKANDLIRFASSLAKRLENDYNVKSVMLERDFIEEVKKTDIYEKLKKRESNPEGALHDAVAIHYVHQKRRDKTIKYFCESSAWFVIFPESGSAKLLSDPEGSLFASIPADYLLNILWLTNPRLFSPEIVEIGLTKLISETINSSLPSRKLLKELDDNISKYAGDKLLPEEVFSLSVQIANNTLTNLEPLNKKASESPDEFISELKELCVKHNRLLEKNKEEIANKIKELKETSASHLADLEKKFERQLQEEKALAEMKVSEVQKKSENETKVAEYFSMSKTSTTLFALAKSKIRLYKLLVFSAATIGIIIGIYITHLKGWDSIEPKAYWITLSIIVIVAFIKTVLDMDNINIRNIWRFLEKKKYKDLCKQFEFDDDLFRELERELSGSKLINNN
ncbi:MAG: hypothetical protein FVQ81_10415 [Candidatus Glassbacteria bacterium]|nr:hypothetical protein [Candidatus Glassbacteria bacterium]